MDSKNQFYYDRRILFERFIGIPFFRILAKFLTADLSIFFNYRVPPYGGGNQFLIALRKSIKNIGLKVENNRLSINSKACLINSHNFNYFRLRGLDKTRCLIVHRVDGPISDIRGIDDGIDEKVYNFNKEFADKTIFQSHYSYKRHRDLGFEFISPIIVMNASDNSIFYPTTKKDLYNNRKIKLISTSWSSNMNKGFSVYKWLEENLDWNRFEYTFVGNSPIEFKKIRMIPPVDSFKLANILRKHDISIFASKYEPCSNSLIEALSCGLPAIAINSGSNSEIVKNGGFLFKQKEDIPELINQLINEYSKRREKISIPSISEITTKYLEILGFG